jgi:hypothetical protein
VVVIDVRAHLEHDNCIQTVILQGGRGAFISINPSWAERLFATAVVPVCSPKLMATGPSLERPRDLFKHTLCYVDCKVNDSQCLAFSDSNHVVQAVLEGGAVGLAEPKSSQATSRKGGS